MIHIRRLYRLSKSDDMGFAYEEGGLSDFALHGRRVGKRKFAEAYLNKNIKAKLVDFYEIRDKKQFGPIDVIVASTPEFVDSITDDLIMKAVSQPYYINDPNVVAWLASCHDEDLNFPPILIIRANLEDGLSRAETFFEGMISDLKEESMSSG